MVAWHQLTTTTMEGQRHDPQSPFSHSHYSQHIHSHFLNTTSTVAMALQRLSRLQKRILDIFVQRPEKVYSTLPTSDKTSGFYRKGSGAETPAVGEPES